MSTETFKGSSYRPGVVALRKSLGVHSYINNEGGVEYDLSNGPGGRKSKVEVRPNDDDDDEDDDEDDLEERELTRGGGAKDKSTFIKSNREAYRRSKELEIHFRKTEGEWRSSVNSMEPLIRDSLKIKNKNRSFGSISGSARDQRIRILCDSDLERIIPSGSGWKRLLLTTVIVFCSVVVYVVGMVAILKGIGGY